MRELGVEIDEVDFARKGLDVATVRAILARAGSVAAVLNARHATAKAHGWKETPPSVATFAAAVAKEPNLMRRPILVAGDRLIVGFDEAEYRRL